MDVVFTGNADNKSLVYIFGNKTKAGIICYVRRRATSCSFQKVKGEKTKNTSKPCAFGSVTDRQFIPNKNNFVSECWISPPPAPPPHI